MSKFIIHKDKSYVGADLHGLDLSGLDLAGVDFQGANLTGANLEYANCSGADFCCANCIGANLRDTDFRGADLMGADLDFSCMPLWCGDLQANYDGRQIIQQLYHVLSHIKYSNTVGPEFKELLQDENLVGLANRFHHVGNCGKI